MIMDTAGNMTNIPSAKQSVLNPSPKLQGKQEGVKKNNSNTNFTSLVVTLFLFLALFAIAFIIASSAVNKPVPPTTYGECVKSKDSVIRESYPAVCVAKDGTEFIQPLSEEERKVLENPPQEN
jgi:hypothetical protein